MTRMLFRLIATVAGVPLSVHLLEGVNAADWGQALIAGGVLAAAYLVLRPLVKVITGVLGLLTLGLLSIFIDAWLVQLCAQALPGRFMVESFGWALACAGIVNALRFVMGGLFRKRK